MRTLNGIHCNEFNSACGMRAHSNAISHCPECNSLRARVLCLYKRVGSPLNGVDARWRRQLYKRDKSINILFFLLRFPDPLSCINSLICYTICLFSLSYGFMDLCISVQQCFEHSFIPKSVHSLPVSLWQYGGFESDLIGR